MKGKPRKTATFIMDTKEKSIIEAQKYEIDKKQIYDFYGIIPKKERVYNVIKKQIAFGKDSTGKIDKNKKYSNYLVFREIFQKEYDIEDVKSEIEQVKLLINLSENTRDEFYRFFQFDRVDYINNDESQTPTQIGVGMKGDAIFTTKNSDESRKLPKKDLVLSVNDFIRKCKMLRRKRDENINDDIIKNFKVYSDLNIPSNKFDAIDSIFSKKNKLNDKYFKEKESLIKCFNREERFINYNHLIKESYIKEAPDSLNYKTKDKYSSYYFDIIFNKREEAYYEKYDNFFSKYNITNLKLKNEEAEFYGKIYGILCKNNYMKFLSYLYSKNEIFKFIYDDFSIKVPGSFSLDNSLASQIQYKIDGKNQSLLTGSESFTDNKIRQKELGINLESNKKDNNINLINEISDDDKNIEKQKNELLHQVVNSYIYIRIGFLNKLLKEKNIIEFCHDNDDTDSDYEENESNEEENHDENDKKFEKCLKECVNEPINDLLLINNGKILKIIDNKYNNIIEQKMSKINIIKINRESARRVLKDIQAEYYILQIKKEAKRDYYIFKIGIKNINLFDTQIKDNFNLEKIKDFVDNLDQDKDKDKEKTKSKNPKKKNKEKESKKLSKKDKEMDEKSEESLKKNKVKEVNENSKEESKKSDNDDSESQSHKLSPFTPKPADDSSSTEKNKASIMNDDSSEDQTPEKIQKVIKKNNIKNASKYQSERKNYEFIIDNEKYSFDIVKGELRVNPFNKKTIKLSLSEITPQEVEEDKDNSCYKFEIKKGKKVLFTILNKEKTNLENFYYDLKEAKSNFA